MPRTPFRVLFVCLGNICRSPAGENILRHMVQEAGIEDEIVIDSAGTHDFNIGNPPDSRMTHMLNQYGIASDGKARQFTSHDFSSFDLILTMDSENLEDVLRLDPDNQFTDKVIRMTQFCSQPEFQITDVPDPYYGGEEGFEFVTELLIDGCQGLLECIQTNSLPKAQ